MIFEIVKFQCFKRCVQGVFMSHNTLTNAFTRARFDPIGPRAPESTNCKMSKIQSNNQQNQRKTPRPTILWNPPTLPTKMILSLFFAPIVTFEAYALDHMNVVGSGIYRREPVVVLRPSSH